MRESLKLIGHELESNGWLQGAVVRSELALTLRPHVRIPNERDDAIFIVASQSCDIANNNLTEDPFIELSVAYPIDKIDGNCSFNKNGRKLHTTLKRFNDTEEIGSISIEIKACEKFSVEKKMFLNATPDDTTRFFHDDLVGYVSWLGARYTRPALPTTFNERLSCADPRGKLKNKAKKINEKLSGIYVQLHPNGEIGEDENYKVNLLGVVSPSYDGDLDILRKSLESYAEIMTKANMTVTTQVRSEDQVSIALIRRFNRFYYDDLSFRNEAATHPVESEKQI